MLRRELDSSLEAAPTDSHGWDALEKVCVEMRVGTEGLESHRFTVLALADYYRDSVISRHHSYETLNMSDILTSVPHRPAPKPPGQYYLSPLISPSSIVYSSVFNFWGYFEKDEDFGVFLTVIGHITNG